MSEQGERGKQRALEHEARIEAMSDDKLKGVALTTIYLLFGERALTVLGYMKP